MLKIFNCLEDMKPRVGVCLVIKFLLLSVLWLTVFPGIVLAQVPVEPVEPVEEPTLVEIPDPGLRAAIAQALGKAPGDAITRAEMETLAELYAYDRKITDLRGIEFAINLTELYLWFNNISDISPLASLTNLTELDLNFNDITDISPLSSLTNLTRLNLQNNTILDISPLSSLTNLTQLNLQSNTISDIFPLITLTNLEGLDLDHNTISDISPLSSLTNLTWLSLWSNTVSDISPLAHLTNLEVLGLGRNSLTDVSLLASLTNLTWLSLLGNDISDISPLSNLINLRELYLDYNSISDIFPLISLTNLRWLHLQHNNISDVETLERLMAQGTVVYFSGNPAFEPPGPKIEEGWVWLIVPATNVYNGSHAAGSGRDFLSEASGGAVTETDVAVNGARAGTRVGDSVWTAARLDATDPNNLNILAGTDTPAEPTEELGDNVWTAARLDATDLDKRNVLMQDANLETDIRYPVAYGVVSIESEIPQQTRVYIGGGPVKVWLNGTLVYTDTRHRYKGDYETALPILLNVGENLLFIAAYRPHPWDRWGAYFGFQDGTEYTVGAPGADSLDVNGDGQVNVLDLVLVAVFYGTRGDGLPADVNADGIVNVQDFAAVAAGVDAAADLPQQVVADILQAAIEQAGALDGLPGAPMGFGTPPRHVLTGGIAARNVAAALADVKDLAINDVRLREGLETLLSALLQRLAEMGAIPETTALLPNYPNPFNPETWIPYHLATDADVTLTIYDVRGSVVRELSLGHQPAGVYESRGRAAYWDGKNALGESVASSIYFYTLTADDFTATRKLLIAK